MPIHDWTRVPAVVFLDFHLAWVVRLSEALNNGVLSPEWYAMVEPACGDEAPDLNVRPRGEQPPPQATIANSADFSFDVRRQNRVVVKRNEDDRSGAVLEVLTAANKASQYQFRQFIDNALHAVTRGRHLLLIDLQPPSRRDPNGIHAAVWSELCDETPGANVAKPLTVAAYSAGPVIQAFVEPLAVGDTLPDMPLFLEGDRYEMVPLEATYQAAYKGTPARWKSVLEA